MPGPKAHLAGKLCLNKDTDVVAEVSSYALTRGRKLLTLAL